MQTQFPKNPLTCYLVYFCVTNTLKRGLFRFDASFTHENKTKLVLGQQLPFFWIQASESFCAHFVIILQPIFSTMFIFVKTKHQI